MLGASNFSHTAAATRGRAAVGIKRRSPVAQALIALKTILLYLHRVVLSLSMRVVLALRLENSPSSSIQNNVGSLDAMRLHTRIAFHWLAAESTAAQPCA